jgi:hypothetical protein
MFVHSGNPGSKGGRAAGGAWVVLPVFAGAMLATWLVRATPNWLLVVWLCATWAYIILGAVVVAFRR